MKIKNNKSNTIKRHIPDFIDHEPEDLFEASFNDIDELLEIEWVDRWTKSPSFLQFTVSRDDINYYLLMAEMVDGTFWVIGYLADDVPELPAWSKITCDARKVTIDNSGKE